MMLSLLLAVAAPAAQEAAAAAAAVELGGAEVLQPTPARIQHVHGKIVDACMNDTAKGVAWFVLAVCALEALVFYALSMTVNKRFRGFHVFTFFTILLPAMAYITMLSGYGLTTVGAPFGNRCFFDGRVLAMSLAVPLLFVATGLMAGAHASEIALVAIGGFLTHAAQLMGGSMDSNNRWFLFMFAVLFAVPVMRSLWNKFGVGYDSHEYADLVTAKVSMICNALLIFLGIEVIMWVLCQGANVMAPTTELIILGLVDVLFISAACIGLVSDREAVEKMGELSQQSMGWMRSGGAREYSSIGSRGDEPALHGTR